MNYKKLIAVLCSLFLFLFLCLQARANDLRTDKQIEKTKQPAAQCNPIKLSNKYHANLSVEAITVCDESGCETESSGNLSSLNSEHLYYLRITRRSSSEYTYYLLDRKTFYEYQVKITPADCGQVRLSLPIALNPGFADTDTVEMECLGSVDKKNGAISGNCQGSFFAFDYGELTFAGPFSLIPTKQTIVNPCHTAAGALIYGSQCLGK